MTRPATINPTAQEINARVLVAFFGWRWMSKTVNLGNETPKTALLPGEKDPLGYVPANYDPARCQSSDKHAPRFSHWDRCCLQRGPHGVIASIGLPDFCNDANLLPRLLDEVQKRSMCWTYADALKMLGCIEEKSASPPKVWQAERSPLRLKVIAALQACMEWPGIWCTDGE
jgi:hypothetical protein